MRIALLITLLTFSAFACKGPKETTSTSDNGGAGNSTAAATSSASETDAAATTTSAVSETTAEDYPFDGTAENIESSTTDGKKITISVSYKGNVKGGAVVNPRIYVIETVQPLVERACIKVGLNKSSEQLGEAYYATIRSEIFREVQSYINPTEVSIEEVKLMGINIVR